MKLLLFFLSIQEKRYLFEIEERQRKKMPKLSLKKLFPSTIIVTSFFSLCCLIVFCRSQSPWCRQIFFFCLFPDIKPSSTFRQTNLNHSHPSSIFFFLSCKSFTSLSFVPPGRGIPSTQAPRNHFR